MKPFSITPCSGNTRPSNGVPKWGDYSRNSSNYWFHFLPSSSSSLQDSSAGFPFLCLKEGVREFLDRQKTARFGFARLQAMNGLQHSARKRHSVPAFTLERWRNVTIMCLGSADMMPACKTGGHIYLSNGRGSTWMKHSMELSSRPWSRKPDRDVRTTVGKGSGAEGGS